MNRSPLSWRIASIASLSAILLVGVLFPTAAHASCGDGVVDSGEDCDLGPLNGDAASCCTSACALRLGGEICRPAAGVCDLDDACDGANPECPTVPGRNVALGGTATQNTSLASDTGPQLAIDGNTSGEFIHGSVTHTADGPVHWWQVDLGDAYDVQLIRVWNRTDCCSTRLHDFHVILSDDPFESDDLVEILAQPGVTAEHHPEHAGTTTDFHVDRSARYVRIQKGGEVLQLAEVQVFERSDGKVAAGTECRAGAGACDVAEQCNGLDDDCPADAHLAIGTLCRPAAGWCDYPEYCAGGAHCPADVVETAGTVCRSALGLCDIEESCDGVSGACPDDAIHPAEYECRPRANSRDLVEICDGATTSCPMDLGFCAGQFDPTFSGGVVLTDPGVDWAGLRTVFEQPDGMLLGIGESGGDWGNGYRDLIAVLRYRHDGTLDASYADGGVAHVEVPGFEYAYYLDAIMQSSGRIVVLTESYSDQWEEGFHLLAIDAAGNLDPTFGEAGVAYVDAYEGDGATMRRLTLAPDGSLTMLGNTFDDEILLVRFDADGALDTSFGTAGRATHSYPGLFNVVRDAVVQPDGSVLALVRSLNDTTGRDFVVMRVQPDGSLDPAFGASGFVTTHVDDWDDPRTILLQPDGKIVVAGVSAPSSDHVWPVVLRYESDGSLDAGFGVGGVAQGPLESPTMQVSDAAQLPDGTIYVSGHRSYQSNTLFFRVFRPDGSVAGEIGDDGLVSGEVDILQVRAQGLAVTRSGKIVVAGWYWTGSRMGYMAARLHGSCVGEAWLGYRAQAPRFDSSGAPILGGNVLPAPWSVALADALLGAAPDRLENFEIGKVQHLLRRASLNAGPMRADGDAAFVRYAARPAKQGAGAPVNERFPKAARHLPRSWELENQFGTIRVTSNKARALLVPATTDLDASPLPPAPADPFLCYSVKATKDITDQTPDAGRGMGKLRRDMQAFLADSADFCALARDGNPAFAESMAEGTCLVDLRKPVELCNRVSMAAAAAPRITTATGIEELEAGEGDSLLCYAVKLSTKVAAEDVASMLGVAVGGRVAPKQAKPISHSARLGNPVLTTPAANFPAPLMLDTKGQAIACIESRVVNVATLP